jgi:tetratricopeptide (TPR) repeat protein
MISAQLAGSRQDVLEAAAKLNEVTSDQVSEELAWVQAIKTAPYTGHAQFSEPEVILELADPGDRFPLVKGFWHYARGIAQARKGDFEAVAAEVEAIGGIIEAADFSGLEAQYLPARELLGIARNVVEARMDQMQGKFAEAEAKLRTAVALQDAIPYMEPPYWYYPVRQTLGAVLLQQDRHSEAVEVFQKALKEQPRNGWALWGLAQAQKAVDAEAAAVTEAAFQKAWAGEKALLTLDRL